MGPLDALWHLFNFLLPAFGIAALASGLCKLLWWRMLRTRSWRALFVPTLVAGVGVQVAGIVLWERDGRMTTYAMLVLVTAVVLWWVAFMGRGAKAGSPGR
jgi:hypothetical protein